VNIKETELDTGRPARRFVQVIEEADPLDSHTKDRKYLGHV
jgi:hypothetical protein